jgi:hypothetical protein
MSRTASEPSESGRAFVFADTKSISYNTEYTDAIVSLLTQSLSKQLKNKDRKQLVNLVGKNNASIT